MKTSTKLNVWFWALGTAIALEGFRYGFERPISGPLVTLMFTALFASYIAELIERRD
jgi:hypothetical protein